MEIIVPSPVFYIARANKFYRWDHVLAKHIPNAVLISVFNVSMYSSRYWTRKANNERQLDNHGLLCLEGVSREALGSSSSRCEAINQLQKPCRNADKKRHTAMTSMKTRILNVRKHARHVSEDRWRMLQDRISNSSKQHQSPNTKISRKSKENRNNEILHTPAPCMCSCTLKRLVLEGARSSSELILHPKP